MPLLVPRGRSPRWTSRTRFPWRGGRFVADTGSQQTMDGVDRFAAVVDLDAVRDNVATLRRRAAGHAQVMAVVKADGYGHGMLPCARACVDAGADWLGVAFVEEALALRAAGVQSPVLPWVGAPRAGWQSPFRAGLVAPGDDVAGAGSAGVDISVSAGWGLDAAAAAAAVMG